MMTKVFRGPQPVDLVVPFAPKDYAKLPYFVTGVRDNIEIETIHVITPDPGILDYTAPGLVVHADTDEDVLPYDRSGLKHRPNWCFQQMAKIFQTFTENDWFLVMDGDIIANNPIPLWNDDGQPIFYLAERQVMPAYFHFNEAMLGYGKVFTPSFLSECVLYSKELIRQMLAHCGGELDDFWRKTVKITTKWVHIADAELYGSYTYEEHPGLYEYRHIRRTLGGRYNEDCWSPEEIERQLQAARRGNPDAQLISIHTWADWSGTC